MTFRRRRRRSARNCARDARAPATISQAARGEKQRGGRISARARTMLSVLPLVVSGLSGVNIPADILLLSLMTPGRAFRARSIAQSHARGGFPRGHVRVNLDSSQRGKKARRPFAGLTTRERARATRIKNEREAVVREHASTRLRRARDASLDVRRVCAEATRGEVAPPRDREWFCCFPAQSRPVGRPFRTVLRAFRTLTVYAYGNSKTRRHQTNLSGNPRDVVSVSRNA